MARYRSLILSVLAVVAMAVAVALKVALGDNHISASEWVQLGIAATTAVNVWLAKNEPGWTGVKTTVAVVLAVLSLLTATVTGGLNSLEITNLVIAALAAIGIGAIPNTQTVAARR